jgi:hypothetical protein
MSSLDARRIDRDLNTACARERRLSWRAAIALISSASFLLWSGVTTAAAGLAS